MQYIITHIAHSICPKWWVNAYNVFHTNELWLKTTKILFPISLVLSPASSVDSVALFNSCAVAFTFSLFLFSFLILANKTIKKIGLPATYNILWVWVCHFAWQNGDVIVNTQLCTQSNYYYFCFMCIWCLYFSFFYDVRPINIRLVKIWMYRKMYNDIDFKYRSQHFTQIYMYTL